MGMFDFLTGKRKKVNLTPSESFPSQQQLYFTGDHARQGGFNLRDFAARGIRGENKGFGDDFTDRMSSPGIAQIDANFKNRTLPTLSNEASKRGLARSSIIQDQIGQSDLQRNRDVAEMVAKFQYLNEQQRARQNEMGVQLGANLNEQERSMLADRAAASERQVGRNIAERDTRAAAQDAAGGRLFQAAGSIFGGPLGGMIGTAMGGGTGFNPFSMSTPPSGYQLPFSASTMGGGSSGVKTRILSSSASDFEGWLNSLFG